MRVVYCIASTSNSGGMERVLANKSNYLAKQGYEIIIITTDQGERKSYFEMEKQIKLIDLDINYASNSRAGLFNKTVSYIKKQHLHRLRLEKTLYNLNADIVISMFDHEVSFLHQITDGSKKVLEIHFSRFKRIQYGRKGIWRLIDQLRSRNDLRLAKKYDQFVVLTEEDRGYWGNISNIQVIPNANSFVPLQPALLQKQQAIAVGRFDYQKGFDDLIRIWEKVHQQNPDWQLKIYGSGELKNSFLQLIDDLKLNHVVHLCPPTKDIEQAYLSSSISLMTSRYEGLPMTLLEAQACGVPSIAYACKCGPKDVIESGKNGFLVTEGDKEDFAEKVIVLIENQSMRSKMGIQAQSMSQRYSQQQVMQQWLTLFNDLIPTNNDN